MENKTVARAKMLKSQGYKFMASVVKSIYGTTYYHVVLIDRVIEAGKWIPAGKVIFPSGAHGRTGTSGKNINWLITSLKKTYL